MPSPSPKCGRGSGVLSDISCHRVCKCITNDENGIQNEAIVLECMGQGNKDAIIAFLNLVATRVSDALVHMDNYTVLLTKAQDGCNVCWDS